jgi:hypothetical protein
VAKGTRRTRDIGDDTQGPLPAYGAHGNRGEARIGRIKCVLSSLHFIKRLLCLARGADDDVLVWLGRELDEEPRGHLYARECAADAWCAIGACRFRRGDRAGARAAFAEAMARVARHPMAHAGHGRRRGSAGVVQSRARAAVLVARGGASAAADVVERALASAPPGASGWTIPIEPLLRVQDAPEAWARVLSALRMRAM